MEWLAAVIAVIAFIVGLVKWRGFRRVVGSLVLLTAVGGAALYLKNEADERRAVSLVKATDLEIREIDLREQYGSKKVFMTIKNASLHTVTSIFLHTKLLDCPDAKARRDQCKTIGDSDVSFYVNIPPGQVRQTDGYTYFSGTPPVKGNGGWTYEVTKIRAE